MIYAFRKFNAGLNSLVTEYYQICTEDAVRGIRGFWLAGWLIGQPHFLSSEMVDDLFFPASFFEASTYDRQEVFTQTRLPSHT